MSPLSQANIIPIRSSPFLRFSGLAFALVVLSTLGMSQQSHPPTPKTKPQIKLNDEQLQTALQLRMGFYPHDRKTHDQLIRLLKKRDDRRAELEEYGNWAKDNPDDYGGEISMRVLAGLLDDPEYAIEIDRVIFNKTSRETDPLRYNLISKNLALLLLRRNQIGEALRLLTEQTKLNPSSSDAFESLGEAFLKAGQPKEAAAAYHHAIEIDNNSVDGHVGLAEALHQLHNLDGSTTELAAAIGIEKAAFPESAVEPSDRSEWNQELRSNSDMELARLYAKYARSLIEQGDLLSARKMAENSDKYQPPESLSSTYLLAEICDAVPDPEHAAAYRKKAAERVKALTSHEPDSSTTGFADPSLLLMMYGNVDESDWDVAGETIRIVEPLVGSVKLKAADHSLLGIAYCMKGRIDECVKEIEVSFDGPAAARLGGLHHNVAGVLMKYGRPDLAAAHYRRAYESEPTNITYRIDYESSMGTP